MSSADDQVSTLVDAVTAAGSSLPPVHADKLAAHLSTLDGPTGMGLQQARALIPAPTFGEACSRIWVAWREAPALPGIALATGVIAASRAATRVREEHTDSLVVTGPTAWQVPTSSTSQALRSVIDGATASLLLVSYASYRIPWLIEALDAARIRGVHIRMLLECSDRIDATWAFDELAGKVTILSWPVETRPQVTARRAAMHAKVAVADRSVAFVTSANLTGNAMDSNLEVGILVRGGPLPAKLHAHFAALEAAGTLTPV